MTVDPLVRLVKECSELPGEMVELGVAEGRSARVMRENMPQDKFLWLYDTFTGIPKETLEPDEMHLKGLGSNVPNDTVSKLRGMHRTFVVPGIFPESAHDGCAPKEVALLHLDVDTEHATNAGLLFFANRIVPGGMILVHDYGNTTTPGVKRAADFFMQFFRVGQQMYEFIEPDALYGLVRRKTLEEYRRGNHPEGVTAPRQPARDPVTPKNKEGV